MALHSKTGIDQGNIKKSGKAGATGTNEQRERDDNDSTREPDNQEEGT
jgi:hypothetical protein